MGVKLSEKEFGEIRTGVIGVGSMGQNHARVYNEISNLVAVADTDRIQGQKIANRFGIEWYEDYRDMLDMVDAVTVAVPTSLHRKVIEIISKEGVNILVEKPIAGSVEDAEFILDSVSKAGIILAVGHIERYNPVIRSAKEYIDSGELGKIITLSAKRLSSYPSRIRDVGVLFDLTIHDVDIIRYLSNSKIKNIYANGGNLIDEMYEDHVILAMEFDDNTFGLCETNWLTPMKVRELCITTDSAFININTLKQEMIISKSEYGEIDQSNLFKVPINLKEENINLEKQEPLKIELQDFLSSLKKGKEPLVGGSDGLEAVRIVEAGLKSLKNGQVVTL